MILVYAPDYIGPLAREEALRLLEMAKLVGSYDLGCASNPWELLCDEITLTLDLEALSIHTPIPGAILAGCRLGIRGSMEAIQAAWDALSLACDDKRPDTLTALRAAIRTLLKFIPFGRALQKLLEDLLAYLF